MAQLGKRAAGFVQHIGAFADRLAVSTWRWVRSSRVRVGVALALIMFSVAAPVLLRPHKALASSTQGPNYATSTSDCTNDATVGTVPWTSPGNAFSLNTTYATASVSTAQSEYLVCTNYGFSIPSSATIKGIVVGVTRSTASACTGCVDQGMRIVQGGAINATNDRSTITAYTTTDVTEDHGSSTDLWGDTWTPSDINASNFGAAFAAQKGSNPSKTVQVDAIRITVYYSNQSKLNQTGYIWENDDEDQVTGDAVDENTQQEAGNTAITGVKKGERLTLRMQLKSTGEAAFSSNLGLFYDRNDNIWSQVTQAKPAVTASGNCTSTLFDCGTIDDPANTIGLSTSVAMDPRGNAWVSYRDVTAAALKVAHYVGSGGNCIDTAWSCTTVDDPTNSVGNYSSIAIDSSGNAWVSYQDITANTMKVAHYVGSGGSGCTGSPSNPTDWSCTAVDDPANSVGEYTSIAIDSNNNAWVSYRDNSASALKVAHYVGSGGSCTDTAWSCTTVDQVTSVGQYSSIAIDSSGNAWVSYQDTTASSVKVAHYVGSAGSCSDTAWSCTTVDDTANTVGVYTSIAFDPSGNAWLSYQDTTASALKVAHYVGSGGSCTDTAWSCTAVDDPANGVGSYSSIAFDPSGNAWVSYADSTAASLKVAHYVGSGGSCTDTAWSCTTVDDPANNVGSYTSIAFDPSGNAWVSYVDSTASSLKLARLKRGGEISIAAGLAGANGDSLSESHAEMTSTSDTTSRDDADCIGGGTWNNGKWFESQEGSGVSLPAGNATAQCTEVAFTIDTSQAVAGTTYRFVIASKDSYRDDKGLWRGPAAVSSGAYATLTIESSTSVRIAKDNQLKLADCTDTTWGCTTVQDLAANGGHESMAIDSAGNPWVSFQGTDGSSGTLVVAKYVGSGGNCTDTAWNCTTISDPSNSVGPKTSMAFDPSGNAWVSYFDASGSDEMVAHYVGSGGNCTSTAWSCTAVDTGPVGDHSFLAIDPSGNPWMSYYDSTALSLKVAHYVGSGGNCSDTAWSCTTVDDPANSVGYYTSIAFDPSGNAWVSYQNTSVSTLKVAHYVGSGGNCTDTAWSCTTVDDPANAVGYFTSLAFDPSGNAWVSYQDVSNASLKVAHYVGSGGNCTDTAWSCATVDDQSDSEGYNTSIAFDPSGNAWVGYQNNTASTLRVAHYVASGGTGCGGSPTDWSCTTVDDPANNVGGNISLAFDQTGSPWVGYYDSSAFAVKVAKLHLPPAELSGAAGIANPGRSARFGDGRYHLSSGLSPRTSTCSGITDLKGFCSIIADDSDMDSITSTNERPMFMMAAKNTNPASEATLTWVGRTNIAPSTGGTTGDLVAQVYNQRTKVWDTMTTDSASSNCSSADCSITIQTTGDPQDYYESVGTDWWAYFRVWQYENSSAETLKTDYFNVGFELTGAQLRHGSRFLNDVESGFDL
jgi:hypothetical protein